MHGEGKAFSLSGGNCTSIRVLLEDEEVTKCNI